MSGAQSRAKRAPAPDPHAHHQQAHGDLDNDTYVALLNAYLEEHGELAFAHATISLSAVLVELLATISETDVATVLSDFAGIFNGGAPQE